MSERTPYRSAAFPQLTDGESEAVRDEPSGSYPHPTEDAFYDAEAERHGDDVETDTIIMGTAIDVSDVGGKTQSMYRDMAAIYEDQYSLFVEKNMDYGSSFETGGEVEQLLGDGPFDDAETANLYKLFTRIGDKRQRFFTQAFCDGDNNVNESLHETARDAMVYWSIVAYLTQE